MPKGKLPKLLNPLFWDYKIDKLSWQQDQDLIIKRVLSEGNWNSVCWLRHKLGDNKLKDWLIQSCGHGLDPKRLRYWEIVLNIPHRAVNAWLRHQAKDAWDRRAAR